MNKNMNGTKTLDDLNTEQVNKLLVPVIYLVILGLIGIPGNLIAFIVYGHKYSKSVYKTIIRSLALVDLSFCLAAIPFNIGRVVRYYTFTELWVCKTFIGVIVFFIHCSTHLLLMLSIHRFRQVCVPLRPQIKEDNVWRWIVFCFVISALYTWPHPYLQPIVNVQLDNNQTGHICPISWNDPTVYLTTYNSCLAGIFLLYSSTLFVLYSLIGKRIYTQGRACKGQFQMNSKNDLSNKMTKIAFTISAIFAFSYIPLYTIKLVGIHIQQENLDSLQFTTLKIIERLYVMNHVANPFIYAIFDKKFRAHSKDLLLQTCTGPNNRVFDQYSETRNNSTTIPAIFERNSETNLRNISTTIPASTHL